MTKNELLGYAMVLWTTYWENIQQITEDYHDILMKHFPLYTPSLTEMRMEFLHRHLIDTSECEDMYDCIFKIRLPLEKWTP